jgi:hypothetical protein
MVLNHGNADREIGERFPTIHLSKIFDQTNARRFFAGFFVAHCRSTFIEADHTPLIFNPSAIGLLGLILESSATTACHRFATTWPAGMQCANAEGCRSLR